MYGFDDRFIEGMDMGDQCGNMILDTSVRHNDCQGRIR